MVRKSIVLGCAIVFACQIHPNLSSSAHARECSPTAIEAVGKGHWKKSRAEKNAIRTWQRKTRKAMGFRWSKFSIARVVRSKCDKMGREQVCKIKAIPCNNGNRFRVTDEPGVHGGTVNN